MLQLSFDYRRAPTPKSSHTPLRVQQRQAASTSSRVQELGAEQDCIRCPLPPPQKPQHVEQHSNAQFNGDTKAQFLRTQSGIQTYALGNSAGRKTICRPTQGSAPPPRRQSSGERANCLFPMSSGVLACDSQLRPLCPRQLTHSLMRRSSHDNVALTVRPKMQNALFVGWRVRVSQAHQRRQDCIGTR